MSYYRFLSGTVGIYEAVERDCPGDDTRRGAKPDGAWLPKVGTLFPGAVSLWTEHGLSKYLTSGLQRWHQQVAKEPVTVVVAEQVSEPLYSDEFQMICLPKAVQSTSVVSADEVFSRWAHRRLQTSRLVLEPVIEQHAEELWELFRDPELHRFVPFEVPTLEQQRERCSRWAKRRSPDGAEIWLNWAGRERNTGRIIASFQSGIKESGVASLGYLVATEFQKRGFAHEGLEAIFACLKDLTVHEVKAWSDTRNTASHQLAKKLGMTQVEFIKDADSFKGATSDEFVFSKLL